MSTSLVASAVSFGALGALLLLCALVCGALAEDGGHPAIEAEWDRRGDRCLAGAAACAVAMLAVGALAFLAWALA